MQFGSYLAIELAVSLDSFYGNFCLTISSSS
jgi:hypothetical protein